MLRVRLTLIAAAETAELLGSVRLSGVRHLSLTVLQWTEHFLGEIGVASSDCDRAAEIKSTFYVPFHLWQIELSSPFSSDIRYRPCIIM